LIDFGVKYGFCPVPKTVFFARNFPPLDAEFTAFGHCQNAFPLLAQSYLAGGHVRVGLKDAIYLERGKLADSNALMVEKARRIVRELGGEAMSAIVSAVGPREIAGSLVSNSAESRRHDLLLDRKAQLPRTFNALRLLERDLFAYKLLQFLFGGPPEMLARRISNAFSFNHDPAPGRLLH
jgi:hypothetical protein